MMPWATMATKGHCLPYDVIPAKHWRQVNHDLAKDNKGTGGPNLPGSPQCEKKPIPNGVRVRCAASRVTMITLSASAVANVTRAACSMDKQARFVFISTWTLSAMAKKQVVHWKCWFAHAQVSLDRVAELAHG
jgi:hypothetical protein